MNYNTLAGIVMLAGCTNYVMKPVSTAEMIGTKPELVTEFQGYSIDKRTEGTLSLMGGVLSGELELMQTSEGIKVEGVKSLGYKNGYFQMGLPFEGEVILIDTPYGLGLDVEDEFSDTLLYFDAQGYVAQILKDIDQNDDKILSIKEVKDYTNKVVRENVGGK